MVGEIKTKRKEVLEVEKVVCGKVAKYRVKYADGKEIYLCTRHFSNGDVQYLVTKKYVEREILENGEEKCQAEVRKESPPGEDARGGF